MLQSATADPIRAPARAQDLTLRHRVKDYRAGDLEARYIRLAIEEDCLVNHGFPPREHLAPMHPREARRAWDAATRRKAHDVPAYVREHGPVHPLDGLPSEAVRLLAPFDPVVRYAGKKPTGAAFRAAPDDEMQRMTHFLAGR